MKILAVSTGRKHGNTDKLLDAFIQGATEAGHTVHKAELGSKQLNGCLGCGACRYRKPCVQKDAMQEIYPLLEACTLVVLSSPLYFWTISAKLKAFIERLYAFASQDKAPPLGRYESYGNKSCILLMTAADNLFWTFEQAVSYYRFAVVNYLGWKDQGMVLAGGCGGVDTPRCIESTIFLKQAYDLGRCLRDQTLSQNASHSDGADPA